MKSVACVVCLWGVYGLDPAEKKLENCPVVNRAVKEVELLRFDPLPTFDRVGNDVWLEENNRKRDIHMQFSEV